MVKAFFGKTGYAKRVSAAVVCVLVLFTMLFSVVFISAETHHDCCGDECPICDMIKLCEGNIKNFGTGLAVCATLSVIVYLVAESIKASGDILIYSNPVSERVRLNN